MVLTGPLDPGRMAHNLVETTCYTLTLQVF